METFEPCAAQLLKLRPQATILLLDCRGAGQSDKPSGASSYSIELLVEDTLLLVDRLFSPGQRFAMVGHSMGGLTSLALALSHPERVTHVVAVAPPPSTGIKNVPAAYVEETLRERQAARAESDDSSPVRRRMLEEALFMNNKTGLGGRQASPEEVAAASRRVQAGLVSSDEHFEHL